MHSQRYLSAPYVSLGRNWSNSLKKVNDCLTQNQIKWGCRHFGQISQITPCKFLNSQKINTYSSLQDSVRQIDYYRRFVRSLHYGHMKEQTRDKNVGQEKVSSSTSESFGQNKHQDTPSQTGFEDEPEDNSNKEGILVRFKNTYKRHGKVCIAVHLVTSSIWAGSFYYLVSSGVDVVKILEWMNLSPGILEKLRSPAVGHAAATYLLYKLATPLRYTVTMGGTHWVVKYLQRSGRMPTTPEENKIRSLLKEGGVNIKTPTKQTNDS